LESPAHKAHALKMARESIVLLKNEQSILPLSKKLKKIAVIGPNADNSIAVLGNYNGTPSQIVTALQGIKNKLGNDVEVVYEKAVNYTNDSLFQSTEGNQFTWQGQKGFYAEYFNNRELKGEPFAKRIEEKLDNEWQEGEVFIDTMKALHFSARYTTDFTATEDLSTFELMADEGYRFFVDGKEVLNGWKNSAGSANTYQLATKKGKAYRLVVEYYQYEGKAGVHLNVGHIVKTDFTALANRIKDADAIVYVGGISPQLEGESMRVNYPGFNGGDRTSILLPAVQTELLKALKSTGKPVVFVMMTGSAIAIPWEAQNVPAIVNAWYGGQSAGTAIADVLFGDYNPSGRLPVTFYKSDYDLKDFNDYNMENRTYRYFKGEPLYGFGYGLSYTTFIYSGLKLPTMMVKGRNVPVSVMIKNTGKTDGEEVVQLYVSGNSRWAPIRSLKGFQRIPLKAGESREVRFNLTPDDISVMDDNGMAQQFTGKITITIGGAQPDDKLIAVQKAVKGLIQVK
jgi:beta-glucosidase